MSDESVQKNGRGNRPETEEEVLLKSLRADVEKDTAAEAEAEMLSRFRASESREFSDEQREAAAFLSDLHAADEEKKPEPKFPEPEPEEDGEAEVSGEEEPEVSPGLRIRRIDDGVKRRWYAIHSHSGQEGNVKKSLQVLAEQHGMLDLIANVLVPMEEVAEIKSGEKRISKRKFFPGYVLVQLPEHPERLPELWHLIKNTPGVTGFIGSRTVPVPLEDAEVEAIVEEIRGERERPKPKVKFEEGERVKIIDGPFSNFMGNIDEINLDRGKLKVMVEIFERLTSVEVEFWQVEKI